MAEQRVGRIGKRQTLRSATNDWKLCIDMIANIMEDAAHKNEPSDEFSAHKIIEF